MLLVGRITTVTRQVAKDNGDGTFDEKKTFQIQVRPAARPSTYYAYGNMNFTLNGRELADFGVDLHEEIDVFVVPKGQDAPTRKIDEVSRLLYEAENTITNLERLRESSDRSATENAQERSKLYKRLEGLQDENVRLNTQLLTMQATLGVPEKPSSLKSLLPWSK